MQERVAMMALKRCMLGLELQLLCHSCSSDRTAAVVAGCGSCVHVRVLRMAEL